MVPNSDHSTATVTSECGTGPSSGSSVTEADSRSSTGRKAISVSTESTKLTPRSSTVEENRIVSSWTRCEAPSMVRNAGQCVT